MSRFGKIFFLCTVFMLLSLSNNAQVRKFSNEFLNIGVDARALGMSRSVVSTVSDATSGYWNPAGLVNVEGYDFAIMHSEYFASIAKYDYLSGAMPVDATSAVGVSVIRFGVDDILDTSELIDRDGNVDYDRVNLFSAADYAFVISYARQAPKEGLSYGANVKLIYRNIGEFANAYGFGFDLGLQYHVNKWNFGAVLKDATTTFNAWAINEEELTNTLAFSDTSQVFFNEAPEDGIELTAPRLIVGVGREFRLTDKVTLTTEFNSDMTFDGKKNTVVRSEVINIDPNFGFEIGYKDFVFLRGGVGNFQYEQDFNSQESLSFQPNLGIGFKYKNVAVDYALTDIGDQSTAVFSNVFSIKVKFAKKN